MLTIRVPRSFSTKAIEAVARACAEQADEARAEMRAAARAGDLHAYRVARARLARALERARAWRAACEEVRT